MVPGAWSIPAPCPGDPIGLMAVPIETEPDVEWRNWPDRFSGFAIHDSKMYRLVFDEVTDKLHSAVAIHRIRFGHNQDFRFAAD